MAVGSPAATLLDQQSRSRPTRTRRWLYMARQNPLGVLSLAMIVFVILIAILADLIAPHDPTRTYRGNTFLPPNSVGTQGQRFVLGTDQSGRDVFSRVIHGARVSIMVGVLAVGLGTLGGTTIGIISGYRGGKLDLILQRVMDSQQAIPTLVLALLLVAVLGPSLTNVIVAIGIAQIPNANRVVRSAVLTIKENTYVEAARVVGCSEFRLLTRYIAVNVMAPVIIIGTTALGAAIISEAFLSFLGMGAPPPTPSWGAMISQARPYMVTESYLIWAPALALSLTVLGWNLAGDALRDILDPRLRKR
jgi:ABC-type dipeptide/oligopeptide/nickel transport system permease subunit